MAVYKGASLVIQSILQKIRCFEGAYTLNDDTRYGEYNNSKCEW
jgi:hypothetical protein